MMNIAKLIAILGLVAMTVVLVYGFTAGDFRQDGSVILNNPWGVVSIVDLYTGFVLFSGWVIYRENSFSRSLIWVVLIMVSGFFMGSLYTLIALFSSGGDWKRFWMGRRAYE